MNNYYTYAYLREDRTPYYIGKGKRYRAYQKRKTINKPPKDRILMLKSNLTEEEAFKHEIYMIDVFGRKDLGTGILHNRTNGGEGTSGADNAKEKNGFYKKFHTEETKLKISNAKIGTKFPSNLKHIVSRRTKEMWKSGIFSTPEYREKLSKSLCKKQYKIKDKEGNLYYTDNIIKFSKSYNLDYSAMYKVVSGKLKSYKGWTGEII
jgi:hypothetical protein